MVLLACASVWAAMSRAVCASVLQICCCWLSVRAPACCHSCCSDAAIASSASVQAASRCWSRDAELRLQSACAWSTVRAAKRRAARRSPRAQSCEAACPCASLLAARSCCARRAAASCRATLLRRWLEAGRHRCPPARPSVLEGPRDPGHRGFDDRLDRRAGDAGTFGQALLQASGRRRRPGPHTRPRPCRGSCPGWRAGARSAPGSAVPSPPSWPAAGRPARASPGPAAAAA